MGISNKIVPTNIDISILDDYNAWLLLAKEVEPLFGPMVEDVDFQEALKKVLADKTAFCINSDSDKIDKTIKGGIIISKESNEIAWFAVSKIYRGMGYGRALLEFAIDNLNTKEDIFVQTFDKSISEGKAARKLYLDFGFIDYKDGGLNPAGISTVIMKLAGSNTHCN